MNISPKKSLGQNFLNSKEVIDVMIEAGHIDSHDVVLEVGPGKGVLTEELLRCTKQVIAVEKDPRLVLYLAFKFKREIAQRKLKLIEGDALEFNPDSERLRPGGYKIIANIPYYLTGQFLRYFLSHPTYPSRAVLLLQKEVVKRIVAEDKKESVLSLSVKTFGEPLYIETVPASFFTPIPKVDSAILLVKDISKDFFKNIDEDRFFEVVHAGFMQKRKRLRSNLQKLFPKEIVNAAFKRLDLSDNTRAEELSAAKWKQLAHALAE